MNKNSEKHFTFYICLFFIIINIILYSKYLFTNEIINAKDIIADHYYGRSGYKESFIPFKHPLWSNSRQLGVDNTHDYLTHHLPDIYFFSKALAVSYSFAWQMVFFFCLAGIFMYLFCRKLSLSYFSSMLAGLFFMMSSELVTYMNAGHYAKIMIISCMPLVLFFIEKGFQEKKIFPFLMAGFSLSYVSLYKHEQILFYLCLLVGFYTIFRLYYLYTEETEKDFKIVKKVFLYSVIMTVLFFALSAVSILSTFSWAYKTERGAGVPYDFAISWSMPPEELLVYFFPKFFGLSSPNALDPEKIKVFFWGRMPFTQTISYLGLFPLFFGLIALIYNRNKYVKIFSILMIITFPLAMGGFNPFYVYILKYVPMFNKFRVPRAILCMIPLSVSVMAGFGCEWFLVKKDKEKIKKVLYYLFIGWMIVLVLGILGWIFKDSIIEIFANTIKWDEWALFQYSTYAQKYEYFYESVIAFIIITGIILLWVWLQDFKEIPENLLKAVVVIVFIFDIGSINDKFFSTIPVENLDIVSNVPPGMKYIKDKEQMNSIFTYRVFPNVQLAPEYNRVNSWTPHFQLVGGYTGAKNSLYAQYISQMSFDSHMLDMLNIRYIALDRKAVPAPDLRSGMQLDKYIVGYADDRVIIIENPSALPRVYAVNNFLVSEPEQVLSILKKSDFNPRATIILEENPEINFPHSANNTNTAKIKINEIDHGIYDLEVEMPYDGFLVFSDSFYNGWKAYVDGKETKIYKTNFLVRSIFLPSGKHQVKSVFRPFPFVTGLWISGITFGLLILIIVLRLKGKFEY